MWADFDWTSIRSEPNSYHCSNSFVFLGKLYLDQNAFYWPTYFGDSRYLFAFEDKSIFWESLLSRLKIEILTYNIQKSKK